MDSWWLKLLGVEEGRLPPGAEVKFALAGAPSSWRALALLAIACAAAYGVFRLYRRENPVCPARVRTALACVRAAVYAILAAVLLEPVLAVETRKIIEPYVILLLDDSLSMSIRDRYPNEAELVRVSSAVGIPPDKLRSSTPSRAEIVDAILSRDGNAWPRALAGRGRLKVFTFSSDVRLREAYDGGAAAGEASNGETSDGDVPDGSGASVPRDKPVPPLIPRGTSTDISAGIREALSGLSGNPVAAIVMLSDGRHNAGEQPGQAAEYAAARRVPIFAVGVGDPSESRDLAVTDVFAPESAFRDDPFHVSALVSARGVHGGTVTVELLEKPERSDDPPKTVARKDIAIRGPQSQETVSFEHRQKAPGLFAYTVRVAPIQGEFDEANNSRSARINILDEQARVLLVAGGPTFEYRMVRTLLTRDKTISVSCWLQTADRDFVQEGDAPIERLPDQYADLCKYDAVLMFDPNPDEFDEQWVEMLAKFVGEHGGGLLWMAGNKHTARFLTAMRTRGVRELLPVAFSPGDEILMADPGGIYRTEWPLKPTAEGLDHPILRHDSSPDRNRRIWESLPGIFWSVPATEPKPGAMVLAVHGDPRQRAKNRPRPMLTAGFYGPGRVVFMAFDGTWRWRAAGEKYFDRYWIQAVRYLVEGRLMGAKKRGVVMTDRDNCSLGERIAVTARLSDRHMAPLSVPAVKAAVEHAGLPQTDMELKAVPGRPGYYEGSFIPSDVGTISISVLLDGEKPGEETKVTKQVRVEPPRLEFAESRLDKSVLRELAEKSGGGYFEVDEIGRIPGAIPMRRQSAVVAGKPIELWDRWAMLLAVVSLLTAEWALRKRHRLI